MPVDQMLYNAQELLQMYVNLYFGCLYCSVCRTRDDVGGALEELFGPELPEPKEQK